MWVRAAHPAYRANNPTMPRGQLTSLTPYSESLERVRSVLVFFAATGPANAAVLAELESEVRVATAEGRQMRLTLAEIQADLHQLAAVTLVESNASTASRMMRGWAEALYHRAARPTRADEARP